MSILTAVIGVIGTIAAALIANWDKIFAKAPPVLPQGPTVVVATATATPDLQLSGTWRDAADPRTVSVLAQVGNSFRFTRPGALPNGVSFESSGFGTLDGMRLSTQYVARYRSGASSSGQCTGLVAAGPSTITLQCNDSLLGSFQSASVRQ